MLTGLFWQIEHDAFYKPRDPVLRGAAEKPSVRKRREGVYEAFERLEQTLQEELEKNAAQDGLQVRVPARLRSDAPWPEWTLGKPDTVPLP